MTSLPSQTMVPTATTLGRLIEGALAVGDIEVLVTESIMAENKPWFSHPTGGNGYLFG
jgi:hypothetical protein